MASVFPSSVHELSGRPESAEKASLPSRADAFVAHLRTAVLAAVTAIVGTIGYQKLKPQKSLPADVDTVMHRVSDEASQGSGRLHEDRFAFARDILPEIHTLRTGDIGFYWRDPVTNVRFFISTTSVANVTGANPGENEVDGLEARGPIANGQLYVYRCMEDESGKSATEEPLKLFRDEKGSVTPVGFITPGLVRDYELSLSGENSARKIPATGVLKDGSLYLPEFFGISRGYDPNTSSGIAVTWDVSNDGAVDATATHFVAGFQTSEGFVSITDAIQGAENIAMREHVDIPPSDPTDFFPVEKSSDFIIPNTQGAVEE